MNTTALVLGILAIGVLNALVLYFLLRRRKTETNETGLRLLLEQMNELSRTVDTKLGETGKLLHESTKTQFGESQRLIDRFLGELKHMTEKVTRVEETGKQLIGFADQMRALQDMLKDGTYEKIYDKWFGPKGKFPLPINARPRLPKDTYGDMLYIWPD
jgi:hypothetical protein